MCVCVCVCMLWPRNPASNNLSQWYNGKSMQSYLPHINKYSLLVQCCASLLGQRWIRLIFCLHISNSVRCKSLLFKANQPYPPLSNLKFSYPLSLRPHSSSILPLCPGLISSFIVLMSLSLTHILPYPVPSSCYFMLAPYILWGMYI